MIHNKEQQALLDHLKTAPPKKDDPESVTKANDWMKELQEFAAAAGMSQGGPLDDDDWK